MFWLWDRSLAVYRFRQVEFEYRECCKLGATYLRNLLQLNLKYMNPLQ